MKNLDKTSDEFGTPLKIFNPLHDEFQFTVDAAASKYNTKLPRYWTKEDNSLTMSWQNERVFCNPPYSRGLVKQFVEKAYAETIRIFDPCILAVLLVPTRTEQEWFHNIAKPFGEIRFLRGRVQFIGGESSARDSHMLVIFRHKKSTWIK